MTGIIPALRVHGLADEHVKTFQAGFLQRKQNTNREVHTKLPCVRMAEGGMHWPEGWESEFYFLGCV